MSAELGGPQNVKGKHWRQNWRLDNLGSTSQQYISEKGLGSHSVDAELKKLETERTKGEYQQKYLEYSIFPEETGAEEVPETHEDVLVLNLEMLA